MGERGFTFVEILIALAILTVGLLGAVGTIGIQSGGIAASLPFGLGVITRGHYVSTATMLAQDWLEQIKRLQYTVNPAVDQIGNPPNGFADQGFGAITGYPNFSRQVRVQTGVPAANMKTVTVTMTFNLPNAFRLSQESVAIGTIIAARP